MRLILFGLLGAIFIVTMHMHEFAGPSIFADYQFEALPEVNASDGYVPVHLIDNTTQFNGPSGQSYYRLGRVNTSVLICATLSAWKSQNLNTNA